MKKIILFILLGATVNADEFVRENRLVMNISSLYARNEVQDEKARFMDCLNIFTEEFNSLSIKELYNLDVQYVYLQLMKDKTFKGVMCSDIFLRCYISSVEDKILETENYSDLKLNFSDRLNIINTYSVALKTLTNKCPDNLEDEKEIFSNVFLSWGFESYRMFMKYLGYSSLLSFSSEEEGRSSCVVALLVSKTERHKRINFRLMEEFIIKGGDIKNISMRDDPYIEEVVSQDFIKKLKFPPIEPSHIGVIDIFIYSDLFRKKIKNPLLYKLW